MVLVVTYIELRTVWQFFSLANHARKILRQLGDTPCVGYKSRGIWRKHYTMSLWERRQDMEAFARSGAHLESMKSTAKLACELRTLVIEADELELLDWPEAKKRVAEEGRVWRY